MQFKLTPSPWTVLGVTKPNTCYISCTHQGPQLCYGGGGGGGNVVKPVFMSVYCELAANSIQKHVKRGRGDPKSFWLIGVH